MGGEKAKTEADLIDKYLASDGLVSQFHENYEYREGQIKMAEAIARCIRRKKTPHRRGRDRNRQNARISDSRDRRIDKEQKSGSSSRPAPKNLQEQLMEKDIPFLQKILPTKFSAAYMKGRSNYACLYRLHKADDQPILDGIGSRSTIFSEVRGLVTRNQRPATVPSLTYLPENLSFWNRINAKERDLHRPEMPRF